MYSSRMPPLLDPEPNEDPRVDRPKPKPADGGVFVRLLAKPAALNPPEVAKLECPKGELEYG